MRIIFENPRGGVSVFSPSPGVNIENCGHVVPEGCHYEIVDDDVIPDDRIFRSAWKLDGPRKISIDMVGAKDVCHTRRRIKRDEEFAPHDKIISLQLPGSPAAEASRTDIRSKYDKIQADIDECDNEVDLKAILLDEGI